VQLLQLRYAALVPRLRTTGTLEALSAASGADLLAAGQAEILEQAWRSATRLRNAMMLLRARPADSLPKDIRDLDALARLTGYPPGSAGALVEDWRRTARRARAVVERVFYT
jgi:glutamate-ammonia-ligase adenylyltransferase